MRDIIMYRSDPDNKVLESMITIFLKMHTNSLHLLNLGSKKHQKEARRESERM